VKSPLLFVSHGAPSAALEDGPWAAALGAFGTGHARPSAVVIVSAHWEAPAPVKVTAGERPPTIHDFSGFPPELYEITYEAPGSPELAEDVVALLEGAGVPAAPDARRGFDHGTWVPLRFVYPDAGVPAVQVSLPIPRSPDSVLEMGRVLAPLRDRGVLLMGSGGVVHNLSRVSFSADRADRWAEEFDRWVEEKLETGDVKAILDYRKSAPSASLAAPTSEHFDPLFFVLGARAPEDRVVSLHEGIEHANLSMRSFVFES
jgi:4,5-DOPA dioxygenase extradiol